MGILINGVWYDSLDTPILVLFDESEQKTVGELQKMVSAPEGTSEKILDKILDTKVPNLEPYYVKNYVFNDRDYTIRILDTLKKIALEYGNVTVASFYTLADKHAHHTVHDFKYGWTSDLLTQANVIPYRNELYEIEFPQVVVL